MGLPTLKILTASDGTDGMIFLRPAVFNRLFNGPRSLEEH